MLYRNYISNERLLVSHGLWYRVFGNANGLFKCLSCLHFTFGSSPISEGLTKISLGSEEPKTHWSQQSKGKEISFKTLYRTQLEKVCVERQPLSPLSCLSFPLSLKLLGFLISLVLLLYLFHIPLRRLFGFSVRFLVSFPSSHWLAHGFGLPYCRFWQQLFMTSRL